MSSRPSNRRRDQMTESEDALKGADITSGTGIDQGGTGDDAPVHSPTIPDDEGNTGDAQGEGKAADAAGNVAHGNPEAPEVDHA
jgi:hypothetical protein